MDAPNPMKRREKLTMKDIEAAAERLKNWGPTCPNS